MSMPVSLEVRPEAAAPPVSHPVGASVHNTVLQQSASVFLAQVVLLVCGVGNSFLVAYLVGPEGRGLVYLMQFIAGGIGLTLLNFGLGPASVFYLGREGRYSLSEVAAGVLWASVLLGSLPMIVMGPAWHWVASLATQKIAGAYLWLALGVIPVMNLTFNAGFLCLARKRIGAYNWLRVSPSALFSVGLLAMMFSRSRTVWLIAVAWAATTVIPGVFALCVVGNAGGMKWPGAAKTFLRSAVRFGWHSHLGVVTQYFQHRSDILLVSYFLPLKDLGLYAFAVSLAELLWYIPHAVAPVLMPHVADQPEEEAIRITPMMCRATFAITALLSAVLAAGSSWMIPRMLPAFHESVHVLWILLPGVVAASLFKILSSDFNGRGKPIETFYPALAALGSGLICGVLVIPRFGIYGAAVVTTGGYVLNAILYVRSYSRMTSVPIAKLLFLRSEDFALASGLRQEWNARTGN
jgi:O-antigen/teichoic acid export membrane protein